MPAVFKVRRPVRSTTTRPKAEPPTFANGEALRLPAHFSAAGRLRPSRRSDRPSARGRVSVIKRWRSSGAAPISFNLSDACSHTPPKWLTSVTQWPRTALRSFVPKAEAPKARSGRDCAPMQTNEQLRQKPPDHLRPFRYGALPQTRSSPRCPADQASGESGARIRHPALRRHVPCCRDRSGAQRTVARHVRKFGVVALRRPRICVSETPNS